MVGSDRKWLGSSSVLWCFDRVVVCSDGQWWVVVSSHQELGWKWWVVVGGNGWMVFYSVFCHVVVVSNG